METMVNPTIMTVSGPIDPSDMGFCHSHEHLFLAQGQSGQVNPALCLDDFNKTVEELNLFHRSGGTTIVDAQPLGCGRMAGNLVKASARTGVNIIAATGFHKLIFYPRGHWIYSQDEFELAELLISEWEKGMYVDGDQGLPTNRIPAKPGVIKTATDIEGVDQTYRRLFRAAALASRETGLPLLSHTEMGKGALEQVELFLTQGVPADSVIICHLDRKIEDTAYALRVAETGVYLEFDTIGRYKYHSDEEEAKFIVKMVEHGFEDRILIGLDTTRERMLSYGGDLGLDHILLKFLPLLREFGLPAQTIAKFTGANPAQAFANYQTKR